MNESKLPPILIPSYHRPDNLKTVSYYLKIGYPRDLLHVFIDSEADDRADYESVCKRLKINLHVFDMDEARRRYDYVHRPSVSRRSAGQARNMFYDWARENGISFYMVQDDDTRDYEIKPFNVYRRIATGADVKCMFVRVREFMESRHIGLFGLSQTGDMFKIPDKCLIRWKVMNTTFVDTRFIYRGERGVQDNDTSQFVGIFNQGLFTGSLGSVLILNQTPSATAKGGLTDLYNECKLLNKALVTVIQFPSAIIAEKQVMNGGRLHHRINSRYLIPKMIKGSPEHDNIAWDIYPEDIPFTNEPKRAWRTKK